ERRSRAGIERIYRGRLGNHELIGLFPEPREISRSRQYFPVRIRKSRREFLHDGLLRLNIHTRKYLWLLFTPLKAYSEEPANPMPVGERAAREVLCLPFYGSLNESDAHRICDAILYLLAHK